MLLKDELSVFYEATDKAERTDRIDRLAGKPINDIDSNINKVDRIDRYFTIPKKDRYFGK